MAVLARNVSWAAIAVRDSSIRPVTPHSMGLLPDTQNCGLRMHRECRERFPRHRLQRKPPVSDLGMYHGTCVTHVPWYMSGSLNPGSGENVPGIPGECAIRIFTYLVRGPWGMSGTTCPRRGMLGRPPVCQRQMLGPRTPIQYKDVVLPV